MILLKVGYNKIFSMIRYLSPTRKSEKGVFYETVWTSVRYLSLLNCTHLDGKPHAFHLLGTFSVLVFLVVKKTLE